MVAGELQTNTAAIKDAVDALKLDVDALHTQTNAFVVNSVDGDLPTDADVKTALDAYDALNVMINKPGNSLNDSLAVIRAVV